MGTQHPAAVWRLVATAGARVIHLAPGLVAAAHADDALAPAAAVTALQAEQLTLAREDDGRQTVRTLCGRRWAGALDAATESALADRGGVEGRLLCAGCWAATRRRQVGFPLPSRWLATIPADRAV